MPKKFLKEIIIVILIIFYLVGGDYFHIHLYCPIYTFLHLYCPGCGATRMLSSLIHGNLYQAFRYNPLLFVFLPFFLLYFIYDCFTEATCKVRKTKEIEPAICFTLIFLFMGYGILRNIPLFDYLKPTIVQTK